MENNEERIQQAFNDRVVVYHDDSMTYECLLCQKSMSGRELVGQHLASRNHAEAGARYAIKHGLNAPESLLKLIPPTIKKAVEEGIIDVTESAGEPPGIVCKVCSKTLTGVTPAQQHLTGIDHAKKVNRIQQPRPTFHPGTTGNHFKQTLPNGSPSQQHSGSATAVQVNYFSSATPSMANATPGQPLQQIDGGILNSASSASLSPLAQQALNDQVLIYDSLNMIYKCHVCHCDLVSVDRHLKDKGHREAGARQAILDFRNVPQSLLDLLPKGALEAARAGIISVTKNKTVECNICHKTSTGVVPLGQHLEGHEHFKKTSSLLNSEMMPLHSPSTENMPAASSIDGLTTAFEEGFIICKDDTSDEHMCTVCRVTLNDRKNLQDHLNGKKHKKELRKLQTSEELPQVPQTREVEQPNSNSSAENTHRAKMSYSVTSDPRGHVHIFNYLFPGQIGKLKEREGGQYDSENLIKTFADMGYMVFLHENLTSKETENKLDEITQDRALKHVDSLVIFFLSHGAGSYTFYANDGKTIELDLTVRNKFTNTACPLMTNKPKLFFTNFCRGKNNELEYDAVIDVPKDVVIIHATTEDISAPRNKKTGTYFIRSLCEILEKYGKEFELREIYQELDYVVKGRGGRTAKWEDTRFKKFYF